jgi:hypothetical protein
MYTAHGVAVGNAAVVVVLVSLLSRQEMKRWFVAHLKATIRN